MNMPDVTEAELGVLRRLWDTPGATIRQLTDFLYPKGGTAHYSTVQKLLERLEGKRCVKRVATETPHRFSATVGREQLMGGWLKAMADKFCEGSLTPLLTHLIKAGELSSREMKELRELIEKAETGAAKDVRRAAR